MNLCYVTKVAPPPVTPSAPDPLSELRKRLSRPTGRGLADAVSGAIRDGLLAEGSRLPPIRALAAGLELSPTTISAAWNLLIRAGTIRTDGRRGTVVARLSDSGPRRYRRSLYRSPHFGLDLSTGIPDLALLPDPTTVLQGLDLRGTPSTYLDDPVLPGLVDLLRPDWPYAADAFAIFDGAMDAQHAVVSGFLKFGDRVIVEDPGFPPLLDLLESMGVTFIGVPVDERGVIPTALAAALTVPVRAVFLQPRGHNPTGSSLDSERVAELGRVLDDFDALIIEDDSTGAIAMSPPVSLGSELPDNTVHIRSFSKSHGPDLRLAALSGPARIVDRLTERRLLGQGWTSRLLQALLAAMLTDPATIAVVERARSTYARRRTALLKALAGQGISVRAADGINIWLPVDDEPAALIRLASRGIGAAAGTPFFAGAPSAPHIRVTAGLIADQHGQVAAELADAARVGVPRGPR